MPTDRNQRNVFDFLLEHLDSKEPFLKRDLESKTSWKGQTFGTYWSKQLQPFVISIAGNRFRVSEAFRRYSTWERFHQHVTQVRRVASTDYSQLKFNIVRIYEFFMPLTNETHLRVALDALFYRDSVEARLKTINESEMVRIFPKNAKEDSENYVERLCQWIAQKFNGYSIYHVNGRFRADVLATRAEVGQKSSRYLIDETTAVARFIFPCESEEEAALVEFFFSNLFVKAIIEVVNGEDEIWMVETGFRNQLHIWRVSS